MRLIPISRFPRHIQSGRNLQMAGASICNHCGLAVADEFRDSRGEGLTVMQGVCIVCGKAMTFA